MDVQPVTLEGRIARLLPLQEDHAEALTRHADRDMLQYTFFPGTGKVEDSLKAIRQVIAAPDYCPFAVEYRETGEIIGTTSYMDIRAAHRGLEIGSTWYAQAYHGSPVNPECKFMLLRHAFEELGAIRVQLKTDLRNIQSQRAIEKLGAVKEGILRKHIVMPDGYFRDTVMYSITYDEWADVKIRLEKRLGYVP
ncbi:MAG TPA: GNAT family protein [Aggregatilineales bacterium]|nr:GNAT family protein [Aggregatilineales bacterium]